MKLKCVDIRNKSVKEKKKIHDYLVNKYNLIPDYSLIDVSTAIVFCFESDSDDRNLYYSSRFDDDVMEYIKIGCNNLGRM